MPSAVAVEESPYTPPLPAEVATSRRLQPARHEQPQAAKPWLGMVVVVALIIAALIGGYMWFTRAERLEAHAYKRLRDTETLIELLEFPRVARVVSLTDDNWAKHRFAIINSSCSIERNHGSIALPYRGTIEIEYQRWASVGHDTREQAEKDNELFPAGYDTMAFLKSRPGPENDVWVDSRRITLHFVYDKSRDTWDEQGDREIK